MHNPLRFRATGFGAAVILAAAIGLTSGSGAASAATITYATGAPGAVRAATPFEGSCRDYMTSGNWTLATVNSPSVWARALTNGSKRQLVSARAVLLNTTTGVEYPGAWSAWYSTTTTIGVTLPNLDTVAPWNVGADYLLMEVYWYDPTSRSYTGYAEVVMVYINRSDRASAYC